MQDFNVLCSSLIGGLLIIPEAFFYIIRFVNERKVNPAIFAILYTMPLIVGLEWTTIPSFDGPSVILLFLYTCSWALYGYSQVYADYRSTTRSVRLSGAAAMAICLGTIILCFLFVVFDVAGKVGAL